MFPLSERQRYWGVSTGAGRRVGTGFAFHPAARAYRVQIYSGSDRRVGIYFEALRKETLDDIKAYEE